jgi:hypothetical protein
MAVKQVKAHIPMHYEEKQSPIEGPDFLAVVDAESFGGRYAIWFDKKAHCWNVFHLQSGLAIRSSLTKKDARRLCLWCDKHDPYAVVSNGVRSTVEDRLERFREES